MNDNLFLTHGVCVGVSMNIAGILQKQLYSLIASVQKNQADNLVLDRFCDEKAVIINGTG